MAESFVAYASRPEEIGRTIRAALDILKHERPTHLFTGWEENDIAGRFIIEPIIARIAECDMLSADITTLNFNVTYEIGYAIGKHRRVFLIKNTSLGSDNTLLRDVGLFDTLGYKPYTTSRDLVSLLTGVTDFAPIKPPEADINPRSPIYVLIPRIKTDIETELISRIKKAFRMPYRSFDPEEQGRLSAIEAIRNVSISHGIVVPLLPSARADADAHNLRSAFVAGLAHGMEKELLLLQFGDDPVPLDYRDLVKYVGGTNKLDGYFADFAPEVFASYQADIGKVTPAAQTRLEQLTLGASSAENEIGHLSEYYLETEEYRRAARGESQVVTGRKGSGKTALFVRLRDSLRQRRQNVVLDLRPEGFQLLKLKDLILQYLESGTKEHTITAFWEYLLLLEICHKILDTDKELHVTNHRLYGPYHALQIAYGTDAYVSERDFAERMSKLMQRIIRDFKDVIGTGEWKARLSTGELTSILYQHDTTYLPQVAVRICSGFRRRP